MADRRPKAGEEDDGMPRAKRMKTEDMDPRTNPYLSHMYQDSTEEAGYANGYDGYSSGFGKKAASNSNTPLAKLPRHGTTAAMAKAAEDGPNNPFNGQPLSNEYFRILQTRRNLPVHAQR